MHALNPLEYGFRKNERHRSAWQTRSVTHLAAHLNPV